MLVCLQLCFFHQCQFLFQFSLLVEEVLSEQLPLFQLTLVEGKVFLQ